MRSDKIENNLPAPLLALVELFEVRLAEVAFPGIDHETLAAACEQVAEHQLAVEEARQMLTAAQQDLDVELDRFRQLGHRALAYVEVYADGDTALTDAVVQIRTGLGGEPKKKGGKPVIRRRKKKSAGPELPLAESNAAEASSAVA